MEVYDAMMRKLIKGFTSCPSPYGQVTEKNLNFVLYMEVKWVLALVDSQKMRKVCNKKIE